MPTATDHAALAEDGTTRVAKLYRDADDPAGLHAEAANLLATAQVHATLEQAKWLREIVDQLDTLPRSRRMPHSPLWEAAALLESIAIGDEGSNREGTIARLVLQAARDERYAGAAGIAKHALLDSFGRSDHGLVREAVALLRIAIPGADDVVPAEIVDEATCEGGC